MLVSEIGAVYGSRKLLMHMCALSTIPVRRFAWSKYSVVRRKAAGKAEALKRRYVIVFRFGSSYGFDCPSCLKEKIYIGWCEVFGRILLLGGWMA